MTVTCGAPTLARVEPAARVYADWLALIAELVQAPPDAGHFPQGEVLTLLQASFDAVCCMHNVVDPGWTDHMVDCWPREIAVTLLAAGRDRDATWHPLIRWYAITGSTGPQTAARVPTAVADRRLARAWASFADPLSISHQMALPLVVNGGMQAYVLARPDRDYTAADMKLASTLAPALSAVLRQHGVLAALSSAQVRRGRDAGLTGRELAVLKLLAQGLTAAAIAHRIGTSPRTVHRHLGHLYRKLGVTDRLVAVQRAYALGLLPPPVQSLQSRPHK